MTKRIGCVMFVKLAEFVYFLFESFKYEMIPSSQVTGGESCHRFLFALKGCAGQGGCCEAGIMQNPLHLFWSI